MVYLIAFCGFVGAWALVIGPVWQAAIELREEDVDEEIFKEARAATPEPPKVSAWWWLLPPVAYYKQSRRQNETRRLMMEALPQEQREITISFLNKANGWLIVALGAFLIAVKETWELIEILHWPAWVFWVLIVLVPILAIANAVRRIILTEHVLHPEMGPEQPRAFKRPRA